MFQAFFLRPAVYFGCVEYSLICFGARWWSAPCISISSRPSEKKC